MTIAQLILNALLASLGMLWGILWALILGFALSGIVMAFVPRKRMAELLGNPGPRALALALLFGAASSSCSYAAASMTRSLFRKGAHIIPALAFLLASTNLVLELSLVLWIMMGWQFVAAEFVGGILLTGIMALLMNLCAPLADFEAARAKMESAEEKGLGNANSEAEGNFRTLDGWRVVARAFVSESRMLWKDVLLGVTISGFLMVLVPDSLWRTLFLQTENTQGGILKLVENALLGPLVAMVSFVCSVGNIPLASVLYRGGIGFGGALSFIYADLIIIPLLLIYRKYFGWRLALWIFGIFYFSMALAGIAVDLLFSWLGWVPAAPPMVGMSHQQEPLFSLNYTFWLNLIFLGVAGILIALARTAKKQATASHCCH